MKTHIAVRLSGCLLASTLCLFLFSHFQVHGQAAMARATVFSNQLQPGNDNPEDLETDRKHFSQIFDAIQAYRQKHGDLPNWLSDLVPEFLPDTNVLMSPVELRTGRSQLWGYGDPKVRSSYIYEFNQTQAGGIRDQDIPLTMKQWKTLQMEEFGPVIPLLRCHLYDSILNLSYSGDVYQSGLFWETDTNALALMARLGPGPGARNGRTLRLLIEDAATGAAIGQARVLATNRQSELGPLPPRRSVADSEGRCEVNLGGKQPKSLYLEIEKPGYAICSVQWNDPSSIPAEWVARLEKATSIGGIVLNNEGGPIPDASVVVNGLTRDPVGQVIPMRYDTVATGADGKWTSTKIPQKFDGLSIVVSHPEFMPGECDMADEAEAGARSITRESLLGGTAKITLEPGIIVQGQVKDPDGKGVARAKLQLSIADDERPYTISTETDNQGAFRLVVTRMGEGTVLVQAPGLAPKQEAFDVQRGLDSISVAMTKGRKVSGQVLGDDDKPLTEVAVSVVSWGGQAALNWRTQTDAEGWFKWDSAPSGNLVLSFSKQGYVATYQQVPATIIDDWIIRLERPFRLTGRVLDAETGELIKKFKLRRGYAYMAVGPRSDTYRWDEEMSHPGDGTFDVTSENTRQGATKFAVWADGYLPAMTPRYEQAGTHRYDFKLERGSGLSGILKSSDGRPVEGARVFLATKTSGVYMDKAGEFRAGFSQGQSVLSDSDGKFQFQPELDAHSVFVADEQGFAEAAVEQVKTNANVVLQPWAVVRGTVGFRKPGPNLAVALNNMNYRYYAGDDLFPRLSLFLNAKPEEDGKYVFERVPPGERKVHIRYQFHDGPGIIPLSHGVFLDLKPGETREVDFGVKGRTVIGRVNLSGEGAAEVDWTRDLHKLILKPPPEAKPQPQPPRVSGNTSERRAAIEEYSKQMRDYWNSEEGLAQQRQSADYLLLFEEDGSFRVEGIPPGQYTLNINPSAAPDEQFAARYGIMSGRRLGTGINKDITIPEAEPGKDEPVDLGTLDLEVPLPPQRPTATRVLNF